MPSHTDKERIIVGQISGIYGVRGEVKIYSYTEPQEQVFSYTPWLLNVDGGWIEYKASQGTSRGKGLTAWIEGIDDRDAARAMMGTDIAIHQEQLSTLAEGEYYWHELMNMEVVDMQGKGLGQVIALEETGANDVLVVQGEARILIPYVMDIVIKNIDLESGVLQVDWDPEYQ